MAANPLQVTPLDVPCLDMRYPAPVRFMGLLFPSAENAYQAARFRDPEVIEKFRYMRPGTAAYQGAVRRTGAVPDWDGIRDGVLYAVLAAKFSVPAMRDALAGTGSLPISLVNYRHENELGTCRCPRCRGRGHDAGAAALMAIREKLVVPA